MSQFDYVFLRGKGNKGASYKYTWKPQFRMAPGVSQLNVFLQVSALLGLAAIPVWGYPYFRGGADPSKEDKEKKEGEDFYTLAKKRQKDERMKWVTSDDMPYK